MSKQEKCTACNRGESYFEGCSIVECPKRKNITARQANFPMTMDNLMHFTGSVAMVPTNQDGNDGEE
jgi:hypothetical protein